MFGSGITRQAALAFSLLLAATSAPADARPASPPAAAADDQARRFAADLDAFIGASFTRLHTIPGISVAVARSGGTIYAKGFGRADLERKIRATADTRFYIASSTKSFVGLAMAMLAREGLINLDWTLAELAPDVRFAPELRAKEVTLRHLLSHSHGLLSDAIETRLAYSGEHDPATLWALLPLLTANKEAPLGTFRYGNLGYNLAAMLVERRLKRSWQEIVETEVLKPLGAHETLVRGLDRARRTQPFAAPYLGAERLGLMKVDSNMQSAGGMFSTARDLGRWVSLQLAAEKGVSRALPADVVAATHKPVATMKQTFGPFSRTGYGLGWYSGEYRGETLYHSFGGYTGARAHVSFLPARDIGVAVVSNDEGAGAIFPDIVAVYAYDWFMVGPEAAAKRAGEMVDQLAADNMRRMQALAADRAKRAAHPWLLSLPRAAYAGRYCNPAYGTITITVKHEAVSAAMGVMRSAATPFTRQDVMRVELIPNNGTLLQFETDGRTATALHTYDSRFQRC